MGRKKTCMEGVFGQFLRESSIHGVKYIGSRDKHPFEKCFWTVAVLASVAFSVYLVVEVYNKYNANPVIISFQPKEKAVAQIPFPAITICNVNILKTQLMADAVQFLDLELAGYKSSNFSKTGKLIDATILSEHMAHYCLAAPSFRRLLNQTLVDIFGESDYVQDVQNYISGKYDGAGIDGNVMEWSHEDVTDEIRHNVTKFTHSAFHNCDDMILKCMWAREIISCDKLFNKISTQNGRCCVFNMMPDYMLKKFPENLNHVKLEKRMYQKEEIEAWKELNEENMIKTDEDASDFSYPKHQKAGGKPYGLSILINPELDMYSTCGTNDAIGFQMVAHSPISFPSIMDYGVAIPPSSEVYIDVEPELTTANENKLKSIDVDKRSCYFPSDEKANLSMYKFYSSSNCMNECIARLTLKTCDCVRYFMPHNGTVKFCGAKKLACSENVRKYLMSAGKTKECKECQPACMEIKYKLQISHFPLRESNATKFFYTSEDTNKVANNYSIVHIFLGADSLYAKERKRLYDSADLLANAGGLLSLTLGMSIISFVEIFYFFTLRAWFQKKEDKAKEDKDDDDEDDDYKMSGRNIGARRVSSIVGIGKPRIMDGLQLDSKNCGYYNWAMTAATSNGATLMNVKTSEEKIFSRIQSKKRKIPAFQLLSGQSETTHSNLS